MTSKESKTLVHNWRAEEDAILVGRKTVIADNPSLTVRMCEGKNPIRLVIDKSLSLENNYNVFDDHAETLVFNNIKSDIVSNTIYIKTDFNNLIEEILNELYKKYTIINS